MRRVIVYAMLIYFLPPLVAQELAPMHACLKWADDPIMCMSHWTIVKDYLSGTNSLTFHHQGGKTLKMKERT